MQKNLENLAYELATLISDYEMNNRNDSEHVLKWVNQFRDHDRIFILEQTIHLMQESYYSFEIYKSIIEQVFFSDITKDILKSIGDDSFLDIQTNGCSQNNLINLIGSVFKDRYGINIRINDYNCNEFYYIDDFSFTGDRAINDLRGWIINHAPHKAVLYICFIGSHKYGNYVLHRELNSIIKNSRKNIKFEIYFWKQYKNDKMNMNCSDVFWVKDRNNINRSGFEKGSFIFSNSKDRDRFEDILYEAGEYIISLCDNPSRVMRPMGYSRISGSAGFGGTIFSYRNCPNTVPLAFWWGDPNANQNSPLSQWYPLFFRKTYYG